MTRDEMVTALVLAGFEAVHDIRHGYLLWRPADNLQLSRAVIANVSYAAVHTHRERPGAPRCIPADFDRLMTPFLEAAFNRIKEMQDEPR